MTAARKVLATVDASHLMTALLMLPQILADASGLVQCCTAGVLTSCCLRRRCHHQYDGDACDYMHVKAAGCHGVAMPTTADEECARTQSLRQALQRRRAQRQEHHKYATLTLQ